MLIFFASRLIIIFFSYRDAAVQKWFERTRAFTKQNKTNVIEQSPLVQIKEVNSIVTMKLVRNYLLI